MNYIKNVKLVADTALFFNDKVLLVKYKDTGKYDNEKGWFLPDDYFEEGEHPDDAASRIVREQIGLSNDNLKFDHFESFTGGDGSWHLIFHYKLFLESEPLITPSENMLEFKWFNLDSLPKDSEQAHHGWTGFVINEILKRKK